jgi:hypothetical protein
LCGQGIENVFSKRRKIGLRYMIRIKRCHWLRAIELSFPAGMDGVVSTNSDCVHELVAWHLAK